MGSLPLGAEGPRPVKVGCGRAMGTRGYRDCQQAKPLKRDCGCPFRMLTLLGRAGEVVKMTRRGMESWK